MPIPQSQINDIPTLTNLAASADSSWSPIDVLQIIDRSLEYGNYKKYYDSAGEFPLADSALEGMIGVVRNETYTTNSGALYGCDGTDWNVIKFIDPSPKGNTPYRGSTYGYVTGGVELGDTSTNPFTPTNFIHSIRFATDTNFLNTPSANLGPPRLFHAGWSSATHGYVAGGQNPLLSPPVSTNVVDKFTFVSGVPVSSSGFLSGGSTINANCWHSSSNGYTAQPLTVYDKYSFSSETYTSLSFSSVPWSPGGSNANFGSSVQRASGHVDDQSGYGYVAGGHWGAGNPNPPAIVGSSVISRFPFTSDTVASNAGNMQLASYNNQGVSTSTDGYIFQGGQGPTPLATYTSIEKFPFAANTTITIADSQTYGRTNRRPPQAVHSQEFAYVYGGYSVPTPSGIPYSAGDKFPYASEVATGTLRLFYIQPTDAGWPIPTGPGVNIGLIDAAGHQV